MKIRKKVKCLVIYFISHYNFGHCYNIVVTTGNGVFLDFPLIACFRRRYCEH